MLDWSCFCSAINRVFAQVLFTKQSNSDAVREAYFMVAIQLDEKPFRGKQL